jgi:hypothetical protein
MCNLGFVMKVYLDDADFMLVTHALQRAWLLRP